MRHLRHILSAYVELDAFLECELATSAAMEKIEARQVLNDQAYFLLCWERLEVAIGDSCREAVRRRRSDAEWQVRRAWDLYDPDDPRFSGLPFENRARLVLDGQGGPASPYALTIKYYGIRNEIAHGKLPSTRIDVSAFVQDCLAIQSALHRAA